MRSTDFEAGLETEAEAFGELFGADDTREGIDAFLNQREPKFEGR